MLKNSTTRLLKVVGREITAIGWECGLLVAETVRKSLKRNSNIMKAVPHKEQSSCVTQEGNTPAFLQKQSAQNLKSVIPPSTYGEEKVR